MKKQTKCAAKKPYFHNLPGGAAVIVHHTAKPPRAAKRRKVEARRNRSNREVAVGAAKYLLTASRLCGASLLAARNYAENAVETLKERGLGGDDGELRLARVTLRIATEIDRQIRDLLDDLEEADRNSRLA